MGEAKTHYEVIVVGAGVAGIYQIKRLVDLGIDATVLDSAAGLGAPGAGTAIPAVVLIPRATPPASRSHANCSTSGTGKSAFPCEGLSGERVQVGLGCQCTSGDRQRARRRQTSEPSRWRFTTARAAPKSHDQEPCRGELSAITAAPSWHGPCPSTPLRLSCGIL
jgi:hypothetical protein